MIRSFLATYAVKLLGAALAVTAIACLLFYIGMLRAERSLEKARGQLAVANVMIERQNEAVREMEREARERQEAARREVAEARRVNERQEGQIAALRRSGATPRGEGPCTISEALRGAEGL